MNINWSLLGPPVDVGARFQEGMQTGRARRIQSTQDSALAALAQDPTNESALSGLTGVNPELGMRLQEMTLKREQLSNRRNMGRQAAAGNLDAARTTALATGDLDFAKQLDAMSDDQRKRMKDAAVALLPVYDRLSRMPYEQRKPFLLSMAPRLTAMGIPGDLVTGYDPTDQNLQTDSAMWRKAGEGAPNIQKEVDYYRSIGRRDLAEQLLERHAEGPPAVARNEDGTFTIVPPSAVRQATSGGGASGGTDEATLRAQAEEAIRNGADPAAVNARLQQMLGGAAPATGTGPFQP